jgi:hypothetical protein
MTKRKLTVITNEKGEVVGTHLGHGVPDARGVVTTLVAGPGQKAHHIEFEIPRLSSRADIEDFHKKLTAHLKK